MAGSTTSTTTGSTTTTSTTSGAVAFGGLRLVADSLGPELREPLESLGAEALSEAARSATVAQNLAGATRLHAAHLLVETMRRLDREAREVSAARRAASGAGAAAADAPGRAGHARLDPVGRARDHLSAALSLTSWHAGRLVAAAVQIHTRLPLLRSAVQRGLFPEQLAIDIGCRLADIPDAIIAAVESEVVGALGRDLRGGHRPSRTAVDEAVDAARERHDPRAAGDAVDAAVEQRTVRFRPGRDGMTTLWANLPSGDAEKLRRRIEAAAGAAAAAGHRRTGDQLRADALCALGDPCTDDIGGALHDAEDTAGDWDGGAAGEEFDAGGDGTTAASDSATEADADSDTASTSASTAAAAGSTGLGAAWGGGQPIRISIIDGIARGLPNRVNFVTGAYASFDWLCQELLSGGDARVRFERLDPQPGVLDKPDAVLKYFISPALAERIRLRDGTCRHPGCQVQARDCDIDHAIAFDHDRPEMGGPTAEWNLFCLCRAHHREKTFGLCSYRPGPLGELTIVTETGHEHRTTPHGPLARARDQILEHQWRRHLDRLIDDDGYLANPPGFTRDHHRSDSSRDHHGPHPA